LATGDISYVDKTDTTGRIEEYLTKAGEILPRIIKFFKHPIIEAARSNQGGGLREILRLLW
jgi:hypothetical protein